MLRHFLAALVIATLLSAGVPARGEELTPPPGFRDRAGLTELVVWQGFNGLIAGSFLGYAVVGDAIDRECQGMNMATAMMNGTELSEKCQDAIGRQSGMSLLGLAAGIATPLLVTRKRDVTTSDALLVNRATLLGVLHGYIVPFAAGLDNDPVGERRVLSALAFTGDVLGIAAGTYLATRLDLPPGKVSFVGTLHSATLLAALSVGNSIPEDVDEQDERIISGLSLGIADLAMGIGIAYLDRVDIGRRRVFWLDTGSLIGWIGGGGLGALLGGSDERWVAAGSTVGLAAGLVLTYWATSDMEEWRRRYQVGPVSLEFEAPTLRVEPERAAPGGASHRITVDALRGRF